MLPPELNELELVHLIKSGDEAAFVQAYDRYWRQLFNFGYQKLGKREMTEGIVQEVFIDLWVKRKSLQIHTSLTSYLFSAVNYRIINQRKSQLVRDKYAEKQQFKGESKSSSVEEALFYKDLKSAIKKIVRGFPSQRRKVYKLRFKKGFSYKEIADTLQLSVSTVEKHMIKALKDLRSHLKDHS